MIKDKKGEFVKAVKDAFVFEETSKTVIDTGEIRYKVHQIAKSDCGKNEVVADANYYRVTQLFKNDERQII